MFIQIKYYSAIKTMTDTCNNIDESQNHYVEQNQADTKACILY